MSNGAVGWPTVPPTVILFRSSGHFSSLLRLVPANEFATESEEQARGAEPASVARRYVQLVGYLTECQGESTKAMYRREAVDAAVALGMLSQFIHERQFSVAPRLCFGQDAFD